MKLPNGDQAFIDHRKIYDYALSADHEHGRHKAALFRARLRLGRGEGELLIAALRQAAAKSEAKLAKSDEFGQRYVIDFELTHGDASSLVRSVWLVRSNDGIPQLVTCYPI